MRDLSSLTRRDVLGCALAAPLAAATPACCRTSRAWHGPTGDTAGHPTPFPTSPRPSPRPAATTPPARRLRARPHWPSSSVRVTRCPKPGAKIARSGASISSRSRRSSGSAKTWRRCVARQPHGPDRLLSPPRTNTRDTPSFNTRCRPCSAGNCSGSRPAPPSGRRTCSLAAARTGALTTRRRRMAGMAT